MTTQNIGIEAEENKPLVAIGRATDDPEVLVYPVDGGGVVFSRPRAGSNVVRFPQREKSNALPQATLTAHDWLQRELPDPEFLIGSWLTRESRIELIGPTGLGKTNFAMALAVAAASGKGFLNWPEPKKPARVLYIDGEMPKRLMKKRIHDALRRAGYGPGETPGGFAVLSRQDFEKMPPLNHPGGQAFVERVIKKLGGVDLVIFDNIQALLVGNMREPEQWSTVIPWMHKLTQMSIGQVWVHHTGHNEDHGYGDKTREWQLDTVMLMKRVTAASDEDIVFELEFTKAREKEPSTRAEFETVTISLADDQWGVRGGPSTKLLWVKQAFDKMTEMASKGVPPEQLREELKKLPGWPEGAAERKRWFDLKKYIEPGTTAPLRPH